MRASSDKDLALAIAVLCAMEAVAVQRRLLLDDGEVRRIRDDLIGQSSHGARKVICPPDRDNIKNSVYTNTSASMGLVCRRSF